MCNRRYPTDLSDAEWTMRAPLFGQGHLRGRRRRSRPVRPVQHGWRRRHIRVPDTQPRGQQFVICSVQVI